MTVTTVERGTRQTSSAMRRSLARIALRGLVVAGIAGDDIAGLGRILAPTGTTTVVRSAATTSVAVIPVTAAGTGRTDATGAGAPSLSRLVGALVTPTGLDQVVESPVRGGSGPATGLLGVAKSVLTPVTVARPVADPANRHRPHRSGTRTAGAAYAQLTAGERAGGVTRTAPVGTPTGAQQHLTTVATHPAGDRYGQPRDDSTAARTGRHQARSVYRTGSAGSRHGPVQPRPAPFQAYPDLGLIGATTSASVVSHLGGSAAVAPFTVAGTPVADRRALPAVAVEVARPVAETPTVSPD